MHKYDDEAARNSLSTTRDEEVSLNIHSRALFMETLS